MNFIEKPRKKPIRCVDTGEVFESIADLCRKYKLNENSFRVCIKCTGKYKGVRFEMVK